jgi:glutamine synthetase
MYDAGLDVEGAKGECNFGQHEIGFLYADALTTADNHSVYKTVAKEIAAQQGRSITFMAKFNEREGSSCHIHLSLRGEDGSLVFWDAEKKDRSQLYDHFVAGVLATIGDFTLLYAPNINSYKRFQPATFAPTAVRWGVDNRTCSLRVVGRDASLRVENRVPGGDVNPYLALAGMIAAALHGIDGALELEPAVPGNAYRDDAAPRVPASLREALMLWESGVVVGPAFGDEVAAHYANAARVELAAFDTAVTDWEMFRGFERL